MDLFGKKRIADLEKENKKLQEEKDGALMLYNTTIKNHKKLECDYNDLEVCFESSRVIIKDKNRTIEKLEKENRDLKIDLSSIERAVKTLKDDRVEREKQVIELNEEIKILEYENGCMKSRIVSIEELFKSIDGVFICDFRKARGRAINASNKRIRYKELNKMAASMEKIIKEITKSLTC